LQNDTIVIVRCVFRCISLRGSRLDVLDSLASILYPLPRAVYDLEIRFVQIRL
jgi:hypothetical protein